MKRHFPVASTVLAVLVVVTGCSGSSKKSAAGTTTVAGGSSNAPVVSPVAKPIVPKPCSLVTKDEAQAIIGATIVDPLEAPQGPTCIYRTADSSTFVSVGTEAVNFDQLKTKITGMTPVTGLSRAAYCGSYGQPTLFVPLSANALLYITAPCATATKFATTALPRLPAS
jgi:hypothetical protein